MNRALRMAALPLVCAVLSAALIGAQYAKLHRCERELRAGIREYDTLHAQYVALRSALPAKRRAATPAEPPKFHDADGD